MAIALSSKTNVVLTDPDFPLGKIKNDPGDGSGTPVDEQVYQDIHQYFARLMQVAGITPNNLHDNATNGYQYINALLTLISPAFTSTGLVLGTTASFANVGSPNYNAAFKLDGNEVSLCGVLSGSMPAPGTFTILSLPMAARPTSTVRLFFPASNAAGYVYASLDTAGDLTFSSSVAGSITIYLDGTRFRIS